MEGAAPPSTSGFGDDIFGVLGRRRERKRVNPTNGIKKNKKNKKTSLKINSRGRFSGFLAPGRRNPEILTSNSDSTPKILPGTGWKGLESEI